LIAQGTGVGLHICKTLIDLMGAEIWLDDTYDSGVPGHPGTRFVIDLQRAPLHRCNQSPTGFCGSGNCDCGENTAATLPTRDCSPESGHLSQDESAVFRLIDLGTTVELSERNPFPHHPTSQDFVDLEMGTASVVTQPRSNVQQEKNLVDSATSQNLPEHTVSPFVDEETRRNAVPSSEPVVALRTSSGTKVDDDEEKQLPEGLSVLFVDDDKTLRKLFCRSARRLHDSWTVDEAHNGETAIEMVKEQSYDLIFMDQYMESTSKQLLGTEAVKIMKESGAVGENTIICGLSANEEKERFLDAGADYFLLKPIQCAKAALKEQILRVLQEVSGETKSIQDDISFRGIDRDEDTADARKVRYQRRRSSCL
jgi:CheY-like chemotaxis protein